MSETVNLEKGRSLFEEPVAFHVMTKPSGAVCNLDCKYCFYLEKEKLYPGTTNFFMTEETLENYVKQYIERQEIGEITFAWQGGEPTLMGVEFFEKAVAFQKKYCPPGKKIFNAFQTNGTLLDDAWASFFKREGFLIGLSIDGPEHLHDKYRVTKGGKPTWKKVMQGMAFLKKHEVEFNTLTVINREISLHPLEVYRFLREHGSGYMQFIPLVERKGEGELLTLATPPQVGQDGDYEDPTPVTDWSVRAKDFGSFLTTIFDEWVNNDVGKTFVQLFDVQLGIWYSGRSSLCVFSETCGKALALEHNGDLYSCDHYVYPEYKLGNLFKEHLGDMVASEQQKKFGLDKRDSLPKYCQTCEVKFACHGECPKHRFIKTPDGEPGLNYLCAGYKKFFNHVDPYLKTMVELIRSGRAAPDIMEMLASQKVSKLEQEKWKNIGRNEPCPCGSGKKYKACHGQNSVNAALPD